jgi:hypothetical protein
MGGGRPVGVKRGHAGTAGWPLPPEAFNGATQPVAEYLIYSAK